MADTASMPRPPCSIPGCERTVHVLSKGLCNSHYLRLRRHGDPLGSKPRKVAEGRGVRFGFAKCANPHCDRTAIIQIPDASAAVCNKHYQAAIAGKDWQRADKPRAPDGKCTIEGCTKKVRSGHAFKCDTHYYREIRGSALGDGPIHPPCGWCGSATSGNQSRFCSDRCQNAKRRSILENRLKHADGAHRVRAKRLGVHFEAKVDLMAVVERDGWVCYICGEGIPPDAKRPDRRSLSIDHEHALANGGGHTFANCRASHLGCNFEKAWSHDNKLSAKGRRLRGLSGQQKRRRDRDKPLIPSRGFPKLPEGRDPKRWQSAGFNKSATMKRTVSGKVVPR